MEINGSFSVIAPQESPARPDAVHKKQQSAQQDAGPVSPAPGIVLAATEDSLNKARTFQRASGYDQPQGRGEQAVLAYQRFERDQQKEHIRQLMGVDIYA